MIVIVGGSGVLGQELVQLFKADDKIVVSIARHENSDADHNFLHNLREGDEIITAAEEIKALDEPLETIINAAGRFKAAPLGQITEEEIKANTAMHLEVPMLLTSNLIDRIKKDGTDIVNISSIAAVHPSSGAPAYGASKSALRGFSADLQVALKNSPSRVISFCPAAFGAEDDNLINVKDVAKLIKQLLDLPKNIEVSEIVINRKAT